MDVVDEGAGRYVGSLSRQLQPSGRRPRKVPRRMPSHSPPRRANAGRPDTAATRPQLTTCRSLWLKRWNPHAALLISAATTEIATAGDDARRPDSRAAGSPHSPRGTEAWSRIEDYVGERVGSASTRSIMPSSMLPPPTACRWTLEGGEMAEVAREADLIVRRLPEDCGRPPHCRAIPMVSAARKARDGGCSKRSRPAASGFVP
jgi:hypothetical protein